MARSVEMFGSVLVLGRVAAADMSADQADAQVYPRIPHLQTFLAAVRAWRHIPNLIDMLAYVAH